MLQLMYPGFLHNTPKSQSFPYTTVRTVNIVYVETYQRDIHRWHSIPLCLGGNPPVGFYLVIFHTDCPYGTGSEITSYNHKVALKTPLLRALRLFKEPCRAP